MADVISIRCWGVVIILYYYFIVRFLWWSHGQITVIGGSLVGHSAGHSNSLPRNEAMALALLYLV
jgi:hypothetical protein